MKYDYIAISDTEISEAVERNVQHVAAAYVSGANVTTYQLRLEGLFP